MEDDNKDLKQNYSYEEKHNAQVMITTVVFGFIAFVIIAIAEIVKIA